MNIFEALSHGKGCINEENISSFLAYLLDPNEDHGLGTVFLEKFLNLKKLKLSEGEIKTTDMNNLDIKLEYQVNIPEKRYIDIVFETSEHIIAIENKILEKSKQNGQLQDEYNGLKTSDEYKDSNKAILMIYLVPEEKGEKFELDKNRRKDDYKILLWKDVIKDVVMDILNDETQGKIRPIYDYTKHTIKAFINFLNSTLNPLGFKCNGKNYRIFKYSSGKILVQEETENTWKDVKSSKAIVRDKLRELNLYEEGTKQNTRSLGAKLFKELKLKYAKKKKD